MSELKVRVTGDTSGFNAALTRAKVMAGAFANRMRSAVSGIGGQLAGVFGTAAIGLAVRRTIQWADQLNDMSRRLGVNVEKLQAWEYAAKQTGGSLEALTATIEKLKKSQDDAARGMSTAKLGLAAFGITQTDDVATMLDKLAKSAKSGDIGWKIGPLKDIGGGGATALIPALQQWQELADEAERVGVIIRQEQINVLEKVNDQFTFMGRFMTAELAPAIQWAIEKLIMFHAVLRGVSAAAGVASVEVTPQNIKQTAASAWGWIKSVFGSQDDFNKKVLESAFGSLADPQSAKSPLEKITEAFADSIRDAQKTIEGLRSFAPTPPNSQAEEQFAGKVQKAEADSLSKVGLFTSSGVNAQSVLDIQRQILRATQEVARNTADGGDLF